VSNDHLYQRFGFDSDWIVKRTGILERRHALPHQATSDLCLEAALRCIEAACAGFMYALITGAAYVVSGASDLALVIGGDCNSRILNPDDIKTYPLFGDGAGAVLLTRGRPDQGLLSFSLGADG